jgi:ubiquinone/menaquinone biosynthesis C-methylase UbiE
MNTPQRSFIPALRFGFLTPLYDHVVRLTTREQYFKSRLLDDASASDNDAVLDVGCGTGTLLREIARRAPSARLTGLDADPAILEIAQQKLSQTQAPCELILGSSTDMPFADGAFDHVISSLFFHHLSGDDKQTTLGEMARVLRPGGSLHVADWGRPTGPIQRFAFYLVQLLDGFETTQEHTIDRLSKRIVDAGFAEVIEIAPIRTMLGTLRLFRARKGVR